MAAFLSFIDKQNGPALKPEPVFYQLAKLRKILRAINETAGSVVFFKIKSNEWYTDFVQNLIYKEGLADLTGTLNEQCFCAVLYRRYRVVKNVSFRW